MMEQKCAGRVHRCEPETAVAVLESTIRRATVHDSGKRPADPARMAMGLGEPTRQE